MNCGSCRHDNEPEAKFCSECGAPLALRCPGCDAEQLSGSKFCNQCGAAMAAQPRPAAGTGPGNAAVRKNVTALFADLVGSTSFGEQVDPEAARSAMAGYFEILRSTIEDHAGTVVKFTGDGVMAVFGVPEVAEDDALRAVAAGQALQGRFRAFAGQVRDRHGVELGLRVGVNTGELVIGDDDADMVGDVLNTAARLEAACQPGRVMVGEDTWRLTRSSVTARDERL
jgi:class 3 adenylate cyclase